MHIPKHWGEIEIFLNFLFLRLMHLVPLEGWFQQGWTEPQAMGCPCRALSKGLERGWVPARAALLHPSTRKSQLELPWSKLPLHSPWWCISKHWVLLHLSQQCVCKSHAVKHDGCATTRLHCKDLHDILNIRSANI